jgi:glycosyltransferase involved in cell wall biosynthesis
MKQPKIWLESTHTLSSRGRNRTGVGHYTEELISNLAVTYPDRSYTVVGNVFGTSRPVYPQLKTQNVAFRLCRLFPGKVWNQLFKRRLMPPLNWLIPGRPDLVVFFNFVRYPVTSGVRTITTIHDLAFLKYPDSVQDRNRRYLTRFVPQAIAKSTHLIAVSESTKRDIIETYQVSADQVSVVYPGVDLAAYRPTPLTPQARQRLGLPDKYFLFVSTLEPRKNVTGLIKAYRALPDAIKREYALVLTGGVGWLADEIMADIAQGDPVGKIIKTSYIPQEDMPALYSGATAYILPSLYEGFGMMLVEAMACGTPVIAARNSSLPEVVGEAGILFNTHSTEDLTTALHNLATNEPLRQSYIRKGFQQAQLFTWDHSAHQLEQAIETTLST